MKEFLLNFKKLGEVDKNLVYLMWTYHMGYSVGGLFINIFIYNYFGNIYALVLFNFVYYIFCFVGFSFFSFLLSNLKKSFKLSFTFGIFFFILSVLLLLIFGGGNIYVLFAFAFLDGLGTGAFRNGVHAYELSYIEKNKRDYYSSVTTAGKDLILIFFPFIVSIIFLLGEQFFHYNSYNILFVILIIVFILSLLKIKNLPEYVPHKATFKSVLSKFKLKEIYQNLFFATESISTTLSGVLIAAVTIFLLKTEINIGLFQAVIGLFSVFITVQLSTKRNEENRLKIMLAFALLFLINFIVFGLNVSIFGLIVFKLVSLILNPGYNISAKVFTMKYMGDLNKDDSMFLSKVIYREIIITLGRVFILGIFLLLLKSNNFNILDLIEYLLYTCGIFYIISCFFVYLEEKRLKNS